MQHFRFIFLLFIFFLPSNVYTQDRYIDSLIIQAESYEVSEVLDVNRLSAWQKVFNAAKESGSSYRIEEICTTLGDFFFDYGLYENAIEYYSYIFSTNVNIQNKSDALINIYRKIGKSYSLQGNPDSAFYYYNHIFDEFSFPERLGVLTDMVNIYAENENHQKSLDYNLQIEELLISNNASPQALSKIYNNIAFSYHRLQSYEQSKSYFNKALMIYPAMDKEDESTLLRNLAISYYNTDDYERSIELLDKAYQYSTDPQQLAEIAHLMATVYMANRDYLRSIAHFEKAEEQARSKKMYALLTEIYAGYSLVYSATHEYDLAFEYFKNYSRLSDSLDFVDQLNQRRILDNQKYIERTEKENRLLKARQDFQKLKISQLEIEAKNQTLRNEALLADSIRVANQLKLAQQKNEIAEANEKNNLLEIARQENLLVLANQQLEIAAINEVNAKIESEKQIKEIELAQEKINLQERDAQLQEEKISNEKKALEIEKRKTNQRNTAIIASLLAGLAMLLVWAYRNKRKDNDRISKAYNNLEIAQSQLKKAESKIRNLLKQQVSGAVAEALMSETYPTPDEQQFVCVMFLDIRDFTNFCEGRKPAEIIAYQNSVFGFMIDIIEKNHGVVNQMMGDGFMATFGAPISMGNESLNAYNAANEILTTLKLKVDQKEIHPTRVGIGLHAGHVVTGNVGNEERKQFSITGNTVILAARLEQLNKQFDSSLVFSKELYDRLPEAEQRPAHFESVIVKGRSQPIQVAAV